MSLEHLSVSPDNGRPVSRLRKLRRRINDGGFDVVNKHVIYPIDAREIQRLVALHGRPPIDSDSHQVLDIGSGTGGLGKALQRRGLSVVCADVENQHKQSGVRFVPIPDGKLPFEVDAFDASIFRFVLHHTPDPVESLKGASKVTKDGLVIVYEDVIGDGPQWLQRRQDEAYRKHLGDFQVTYTQSTDTGTTYRASDWLDVFDAAGLTVVDESKVLRPGAPVQRRKYVLKEV